MSEAQTFEDYIRMQAERGQLGVCIIPTAIAFGIADWIERQRDKIDEIDVVRCKDCDHCENGRCYLLKDITIEVRDCDFCSYGERKDDL